MIIPVAKRPYRLPEAHYATLKELIDKLKAAGIIEDCNSASAAPCMLIMREGKPPRLVIDYRALNMKVVADNYPLPLIEELLAQLGEGIYFSTMGGRKLPSPASLWPLLGTPLQHFVFPLKRC
uniref:Reverse transcriptase domain-containing protein n=1 Tax=Strigamia maritima TaxID=126957 RepID=T1JFI0_STRMM